MTEDRTLYEFSLHDLEGNLLRRIPCVPPFEVPPDVAISGERYFVLMDDQTYQEVERVHWLPSIVEVAPGPGQDSG